MKALTNVWLVLGLVGLVRAQADPIGPIYPPPGGVNWAQVSGTLAGNAGGVVWSYSGFDATAFDTLYWGATATVTAGLDGYRTALTFSGWAGNQAIWTGNSPFYSPFSGYIIVPIRFLLTLNPLTGSAAWETPSWHAALGPVVNNSDGDNYQVRLEFVANPYGWWVPLNSLYDGAGANSDFMGGFYYTEPTATPERGSTLFLVVGALGCLVMVYRRS